jgi:CHASE1-domain containing sensor protein
VGRGARFPRAERRIQHSRKGSLAMKTRHLLPGLAAIALLLSACGVAETAAVAASQGASAAEQAKQAKEMEEKVIRDVEAAQKAADDARNAAEAQAEAPDQAGS